MIMWINMLRCIFILSFLLTIKGQSYDLSDDELVDRVNYEVENFKPSRKRVDFNEQFIHHDNQENVYSVPSQYLEPPAKFYSRSINDFPFEEVSTDSTTKNQDLSTASSYDTSTIKTLKIYEITSFNSSTTYKQNHDDKFEIKTSTDSTGNDNIKNNFRGSTDTFDPFGNKEKNTWKNDHQSSAAPRDKINPIRTSFSRGNQRYQDNIGETINKKNDWQSRPVDNWKEKSNQQTNYNKFQDRNSGAAPGTPDYPINYEHIYYKLQNNNGRFPCPKKLTTHFYLADRLSRCQIFYVCYGTRGNGVPMICPNGTLFNEKLQVCDWWYNVTC